MITRKILLGGLVATAAIGASLALASSANASVAVTDGVGSVGKGDVQTALGYANDAAFQKDAAKITFSQASDTMSTVAVGVKCAPIDASGAMDMSQVHVISVNLGNFSSTTKTFNATPKATGGKVTGWNLTGNFTETTTPDTTNYSKATTSCPVGEHFAGWVDAAHAFTNPITPGGGLMVSNGIKTVALPNTPVV